MSMTDNATTGENMSDTPQTRASHLFLVRVWAEEVTESKAEWCGKVQHVLTGKAEHFTDLDKISGLFESLMPEDGAEQLDVRSEVASPPAKPGAVRGR
jgi:hypothetical protein